MDVVNDSADFNQVPVFSSDDSADVFVKPFDEFIADRFSAIFGTENNVVREFCKGAHGLLSPLRGYIVFIGLNPQADACGYLLPPLRGLVPTPVSVLRAGFRSFTVACIRRFQSTGCRRFAATFCLRV